MRFCQSDGTPLVEIPVSDPYKTMIGRPDQIGSAPESTGSKEGDVLQLPPEEKDPRKTMYASEAEIRREMSDRDADENELIELPPLAPDPPRFNEPAVAPPSFSDSMPKPSTPTNAPAGGSPFSVPPPTPFNPPMPEPSRPFESAASSAETVFKPEPRIEAASNPFNQPQMSPPPMPMAPQGVSPGGFSPNPSPVVGVGQNQTLAIVSLALGVLSILCCGILTGIPAVITGFMAKSKAEQNPSEFGGRGLALGGIITGAIGIVLGIIGIIYYVLVMLPMMTTGQF